MAVVGIPGVASTETSTNHMRTAHGECLLLHGLILCGATLAIAESSIRNQRFDMLPDPIGHEPVPVRREVYAVHGGVRSREHVDKQTL